MTTQKPKETWKTWVGPVPEAELIRVAEPLLTRDELLSRLKDMGVAATRRDIEYWQGENIIPRPTRRREGTATITVYPAWMPDLIRTLRKSQQYGLSLTEIAALLRGDVARYYGNPLDEATQDFIKRRATTRERDNRLKNILSPLAKIAQDIETVGNMKVGKVEVIFHRVPDDFESDLIRIDAAWPAITYSFEDEGNIPIATSGWDSEIHFTDWAKRA